MRKYGYSAHVNGVVDSETVANVDEVVDGTRPMLVDSIVRHREKHRTEAVHAITVLHEDAPSVTKETLDDSTENVLLDRIPKDSRNNFGTPEPFVTAEPSSYARGPKLHEFRVRRPNPVRGSKNPWDDKLRMSLALKLPGNWRVAVLLRGVNSVISTRIRQSLVPRVGNCKNFPKESMAQEDIDRLAMETDVLKTVSVAFVHRRNSTLGGVGKMPRRKVVRNDVFYGGFDNVYGTP